MLDIQPLHWGKIKWDDKSTFPTKFNRVILHFKPKRYFAQWNGDQEWLYDDGTRWPVYNGDIWSDIPEIPPKLLTRKK